MDLKQQADLFSGINIDLQFNVPFEWSIDALSESLATWLICEDALLSTSKAGILSSTECAALSSLYLSPLLGLCSRIFIFAASLLHNSPRLEDLDRYKDEPLL